MKNSAAGFLTETDKDRIKEAVKNAEKTTSGEIVPMIVSHSYSYPLANMRAGLIFGLISGIAYTLIFKDENIWLFLAVFIITLIVIHKIADFIPLLKRLFITPKEIEEEVQEAALISFYESELYRTRDETGVLIFISVFEKKVWLLADKGINSRIKTDEWQNIVDDIIKGIKSGKQAEAIVKAVERVGNKLSKHFPVKKDDTNELKNLIIKN
ncbi:MAG: TPM domain-containing protein [Spirochaetes bacterium]|nr:TPM domain-containing protein [Spirochaetota bacterium]